MATAVQLQADGKILVGGYSALRIETDEFVGDRPSFAVARYLPNGRLDPTFGATAPQ